MSISVWSSVWSIKRMAAVGCFMLLIMASIAHGDVSCSIGLANSEGSATESISLSNAEYKSVSILNPSDSYGGLPYSIISEGSGKSTSNSGKFSESVSVSGSQKPGEIDAKVETQNGAFSWSKKVNIGSLSPDTSMSIKTSVSDGILDSAFSNLYSKAEKKIQTANSKYSDQTLLLPLLVLSNGKGQSTQEIGNDFSSHLVGETADKQAVMDASLSFKPTADLGADSKWSDSIRLDPESGSMSQYTTALSNNKCQLKDVQTDSGQFEIRMAFTPYDIRTGAKIFETKYVPWSDDDKPRAFYILVLPRVNDNEPSYYDFKTLSMRSNWHA